MRNSVSIDNPGFRRMVQRSDDQERRVIANWITSTDYATLQADYLKRREMGTGLWLLETTEFREWKAKKRVLYCPGIPGAGKTIFPPS
jgi:hypothetical protein